MKTKKIKVKYSVTISSNCPPIKGWYFTGQGETISEAYLNARKMIHSQLRGDMR